MDTETKQAVYQSSAYDTAGGLMMSFGPINAIHQHICAFHVYATDHTRHIEAHHFCTHRSKDFHQCVIYDSDAADARLIGIEYIVSEQVFIGLPDEEKRYWHSHKYEVESGLLQLQMKSAIPQIATDEAEQPAMLEIQKTYGKTIHTWAFDVSPELPLGPPQLMMAAVSDKRGVPSKLVQKRDKACGTNTEAKKELRATYLPLYEVAPGADGWMTTFESFDFEPVQHKIKVPAQQSDSECNL